MSEGDRPNRIDRLRSFALRWVLLPVGIALALVLAGTHLGARHSDAWYTRAARFVGDALR